MSTLKSLIDTVDDGDRFFEAATAAAEVASAALASPVLEMQESVFDLDAIEESADDLDEIVGGSTSLALEAARRIGYFTEVPGALSTALSSVMDFREIIEKSALGAVAASLTAPVPDSCAELLARLCEADQDRRDFFQNIGGLSAVSKNLVDASLVASSIGATLKVGASWPSTANLVRSFDRSWARKARRFMAWELPLAAKRMGVSARDLHLAIRDTDVEISIGDLSALFAALKRGRNALVELAAEDPELAGLVGWVLATLHAVYEHLAQAVQGDIFTEAQHLTERAADALDRARPTPRPLVGFDVGLRGDPARAP